MQENIRDWNYLQTMYKEDKNVEEAGKKWLLGYIPEIYFGELNNRKTKFKHVSLRTMVDQIFDDYPATQEDISKVKQQLRDPWDPRDEIVNLWERTDHALCEMAAM